MKKYIALCALVTAALLSAPRVRAEDKAPAAATETKPAKKNADATPFHAKVTAVDAAGSTITVGELKLNITSATKISKDGKTATLADFTVGADAHGSYKKDADGKMNANSLRTGEKAPKGSKKKKAKTE